MLREQRAKFAKLFHPDIENEKGLEGRDLARLFPYSDKQKLAGTGRVGPLIRILGHDFTTFVEESWKVSRTEFALPSEANVS